MFCDTQNTFPFLPISDIYAIFVKGIIVALASYGLAFTVSLQRARSMKFQVWTGDFSSYTQALFERDVRDKFHGFAKVPYDL